MPISKIIPAGTVFGRLTVIGLDHIEKHNRINNKTDKTTNYNIEFYHCVCDCGKNVVIRKHSLKSGLTKSCGCYNKDRVKETLCSHKKTHTRLYRIWASMKQRCYNNRCNRYKDWGGRGITVCDEWKNNFTAFHDWAMANGYKDDLTIDRIDNNGNYCPDNCRWATKKQQSRNTRFNNIIEYNGIKLTVTEWTKKLGFPNNTIYSRLSKLHWPAGKALATPLLIQRKK